MNKKLSFEEIALTSGFIEQMEDPLMDISKPIDMVVKQLQSSNSNFVSILELAQPAITCSKLTVETLEQSVKHVQG